MGFAAIAAPCGRMLQNHGAFPVVQDTISLPDWSPVYVVVFLPLMAYIAVSVLLRMYYVWVYPISDSAVDAPPSAAWLRETKLQHACIALLASFVFGVGLAISGMCDPGRVIRFLDFTGPDGWDPSLMGVMLSGVMFNTVTFHLMHKYGVEVMVAEKADPDDKITLNNVIKIWRHPANLHLPPAFVMGAVLFGLGWGLSGICPGPALVNLGAFSRVSAAFLPPLLLGMAMHELFKSLPDWNKRKKDDESSAGEEPLIANRL